MPVLFVRSGVETFAVPLEQIDSILYLEDDLLEKAQSRSILYMKEEALNLFNLESFVQSNEMPVSDQRYGLQFTADDQQMIVLVDALAGTQEVLVKSLGSHLRNVMGISGATISNKGQVVLILDLLELVLGEVTASAMGSTSTPSVAIPPVRGEGSNQRCALVVDDSMSMRKILQGFLERSGWTIIMAKDGVEALEKLAGQQPDVAIVDIEMPRMNGYELLAELKADATYSSLPVVFLTSRSTEKHRERAMQLGVDDYVVKPYEESHLMTILERLTRTQVASLHG